MSDTSHNDDDSIVSGRDIHDAMHAFASRDLGLDRIDPDKTEKLWGLFEMDAGLAAGVKSLHGVLTSLFADKIQTNSYNIVRAIGKKAGMEPAGSNLARTAALAAMAVDVAMKTGPYAGPFFSQWKEANKKKKDLALDISSVLDDKIGKHSVGALSAASHDNEMIRVKLARLNKQASLKRSNSVIDLVTISGANVGLGLLSSFGRTKHVWNGGDFHGYQFDDAAAKQMLGGNAQGHAAQSANPLVVLREAFNGLSPQFAQRFRAKNRSKLDKLEADHCALDMVTTLQKQVEHNPNARSFQMPGRRGDSYGLEEYIMRVMIQHQKDMSGLSADHTELRPALKDEMAAAAKPMADAIRKGDIGALQLITLIGERQVIKSNGRAIASPEEVEDYLDRSAEKPAATRSVDAKEWVKEASFTTVQLKAALKKLHGEERENFAGMFPDSVLEAAGISVKEVKQIRESIAERYEPMLTECLLGLGKRTDDELKREGLASHEIKQLRQAVTEIERLGMEAVHSMKAGPTNSHGIERPITNWAVNNIEYLGRVLEEGRAAEADVGKQPKKHSDHVEKHMGNGHAERVRGHNDNEANDNEMSHAERLRAEAGHGYQARH